MLGAQQKPADEGPVISSRIIRLTKDAAAAVVACSALFVVGIPGARAACGQSTGSSAGEARRAVIALQNLDSQGPVYYWHDSATYALLYFRPEDLVARLESLRANQAGAASLAPALLDNIKVDLPLKESTDLFRYTLIDQRFDTVMNLVIADLMKEGRVMLDQWVIVENPLKSIVMVSRGGSGGDEARWFCTAKDDVLFKSGAVD